MQALPTHTGSWTKLGLGPCSFPHPCCGCWERAEPPGWVLPHRSTHSSLWGGTWQSWRPMGGRGDAPQPSSSLFPSFQLTVEMFDYLECELNLFQTGKPPRCQAGDWVGVPGG